MTARACLPEPPCDCFTATFGLPVFGEGGVEFDVELARRIVGDIEQFDGFLPVRGHGQKTKGSEQGEGEKRKMAEDFHRERQSVSELVGSNFRFFGAAEKPQNEIWKRLMNACSFWRRIWVLDTAGAAVAKPNFVWK